MRKRNVGYIGRLVHLIARCLASCNLWGVRRSRAQSRVIDQASGTGPKIRVECRVERYAYGLSRPYLRTRRCKRPASRDPGSLPSPGDPEGLPVPTRSTGVVPTRSGGPIGTLKVEHRTVRP